MTPRTERSAVEKLYRVRQYLHSTSYRGLTFEECMARTAAVNELYRVQRLFW